jgi:hypothetical protein
MAAHAEAQRAGEPAKSLPKGPSAEAGSESGPEANTEAAAEADIARRVVNFQVFEGGMGARK